MSVIVTNAKTTITTTARQSHMFDLTPDEAHRITDGRNTFIVDHVWVLAHGKNGYTLDFVDYLEVYAKGFADGQRGDYVNGLNREFSRKWHNHIGWNDTQFSTMPGFIAAIIRDRTPLGALLDHSLRHPEFYLNDPNHPEYITPRSAS